MPHPAIRDERPDLEPGFWCEYTPPKSAVSRLAQGPAYLIDGYSLSDAYMRDERAARKSERSTTPPDLYSEDLW